MTQTTRAKPCKTIGFWCAMIMALAQATSALRAFADPEAFSIYMGLPVSGPNELAFVMVYALRTTLIAGLTFYLAITGRLRALAVIALIALALPIGDALLSAQANADPSIVTRHTIIAGFLAFTAIMLFRDSRRIDAR